MEERTGLERGAEREDRDGFAFEPSSVEATLVQALSLLDQGRVEAARRVLRERVRELAAKAGAGVSGVTQGRARGSESENDFDGGVSEGELERAFAVAQPDLEQLVDADRVAHEAMRDAQLDAPEAVGPAAANPLFATRTMADLLERQGDSAGASRIRAALAADGAGNSTERRAERRRVIETLETWLVNLRREPR